MQLLPPNSRVEGKVIFRGDSVLDLTPMQMQKFRGEAVALIFQDPMTRLDPQYRLEFGAGGRIDATPDLQRMHAEIARNARYRFYGLLRRNSLPTTSTTPRCPMIDLVRFRHGCCPETSWNRTDRKSAEDGKTSAQM
jgi:ABC-type microcin C transport system duplicated ATPase subunit YejF